MPEGLNNNISAFQSLITCNLHLQPTAKPIMRWKRQILACRGTWLRWLL